jgi:hypothetical protein
LEHERPGASSSSNTGQPSSQVNQPLVRNTTKSFNIEGLTVYFDEFIVRDDYDLQENNPSNFTNSNSNLHTAAGGNSVSDDTGLDKSETSLNSTIELSEENDTSTASSTSSPNAAHHQNNPASRYANKKTAVTAAPTDEAAPFNFELNTDYYLYTNPIILITFGGTQSIKLTVNNLKPSEFIMEAASGGAPANNAYGGLGADQQRPLLELSAQFGSIKCLLCPKQIHLLGEMLTKVSDYIESVEQYKRALKYVQLRQQQSSARKRGGHLLRGMGGGKSGKTTAGRKDKQGNKPIRGFTDARKYDSLVDSIQSNQSGELIVDNEENEFYDGIFFWLILWVNGKKNP